MSLFVEMETLRPWRGLAAGARFRVMPNAARLLDRMRVAVPVTMPAPVDVIAAVEAPKRPRGRARKRT